MRALIIVSLSWSILVILGFRLKEAKEYKDDLEDTKGYASLIWGLLEICLLVLAIIFTVRL